jgi:tetratricopeptide (TPR) repeat protein
MPQPIWQWKSRFRRNSFGWKSQPAITRIKEAVSEIKQVAKKDPLLGAEGAVLFLERVAPAIEQVDSSSGSIGTAVNGAIRALVPLIAAAPADVKTRQAWLERLWQTRQTDDMPYLELLDERWGELCAGPELAGQWAEQLLGVVAYAWRPDRDICETTRGTVNCLSSLFTAGRHDELLTWLQRAPFVIWHWHVWGVRALAAQGRTDEALQFALRSLNRNDSPASAACECESILLAAGRVEEAYRDHALLANRLGTNLGTYRAIAKKYRALAPAKILRDLIASTPGEEGKWFATAKELGMWGEAVALAQTSPCDPKTLARAARDFATEQPAFAVQAGLAALNWLAQGYGYDVTSADVWAAHQATLQAAEAMGDVAAVKVRMRQVVAQGGPASFVAQVLGRVLG